MPKKGVFILFSILLVIVMSFLVNGDLLITPFSLDITSIVGEEKLISMNFTNTYNFTIYNISIYEEEGFSLNSSEILLSNQSKIINLKILTSQKINKTGNLIFYFYYTRLEQTLPITYHSNVTDSEFILDVITLHRFDKIFYLNTGNDFHTITDVDGSFDETIQPGKNVTISFALIKDYTVFDIVNGSTQIVHCLNNTIKTPTHKNEYDKSIPFTLKSIYSETNLELELLVDEMEVPYDESHEGVFSIKNTGNKTAKSIRFSCLPNWCVYFSKPENNFDLEPGELNYVTFIIAPLISSSSETNKTHIIKITGKSDNAQEVYDNLSVFIPYTSQVFETNVTDIDLKYLHEVFCPAHPTSILCANLPIIVYKNRTIYEIPPTVVDFSAKEIVEWRVRLSQLETDRRLNTERLNNVETAVNSILSKIDKISADIVEMNKRDESQLMILFIIGSFFIILLLLTFGFMIVKESKKRRKYKKIESL